LIKCEL
jgi:hypothetical protein